MDVFETGYNIEGFGIDTLNITDPLSVSRIFNSFRPDIVLHTAAYTDVDGCESNKELAMEINAVGTSNIAATCNEMGARLIYYSTDYVFDGTKKEPYIENDTTNPINIYGRSKLEGEKAVENLLDDYIILRIGRLFGKYGSNFPKKMINLAKQQSRKRRENQEINPIKVVNDQFGSPTWTKDIASQTKIMIDSNLSGLFHCTSEGSCSWYQFAEYIFKKMDKDILYEPCSSSEFSQKAARPVNSILENNALKSEKINHMRSFKEAFDNFYDSSYGELFDEM
jgi:dTDP-4-dehydrorhamnose reductase